MKRRLTGAVLVALFTMLLAGAVPALAFDRSANEATMLRLINQARRQPRARRRQAWPARSTGRRWRTPGT